MTIDDTTCSLVLAATCRADDEGWLSYALGELADLVEIRGVAADDAGTWRSVVTLHGVRSVP